MRPISRLVATLAALLLLLGVYSCSRFKTMYLCMRSKADDAGVSADDIAKGVKGGKAGLIAKAKGGAAGLTAEDGSPVSGAAGSAAGTAADGTPLSAGAAGTAADGTPLSAAAGGTGAGSGSAAASGPAPGSLVMARKLSLMGEISGDRIKMIKSSNDKIYVFFYDAPKRDIAEKLESGTDYDVTFRKRASCPGESDECGDLVNAEEH